MLDVVDKDLHVSDDCHRVFARIKSVTVVDRDRLQRDALRNGRSRCEEWIPRSGRDAVRRACRSVNRDCIGRRDALGTAGLAVSYQATDRVPVGSHGFSVHRVNLSATSDYARTAHLNRVFKTALALTSVERKLIPLAWRGICVKLPGFTDDAATARLRRGTPSADPWIHNRSIVIWIYEIRGVARTGYALGTRNGGARGNAFFVKSAAAAVRIRLGIRS